MPREGEGRKYRCLEVQSRGPAPFGSTWTGNRNESSGSSSTFNPRLGSSLNVQFLQPLLRGFETDLNRFGLESANRLRVVSDLQLQQQVVGTEVAVRFAYLGVLG